MFMTREPKANPILNKYFDFTDIIVYKTSLQKILVNEEIKKIGWIEVLPSKNIIKFMDEQNQLKYDKISKIIDKNQKELEHSKIFNKNIKAKLRRFTSTKRQKTLPLEVDPDIPDCSICRSKDIHTCITKCGHFYCYECLVNLINVNKKCSQCRIPLNNEDFKIININDNSSYYIKKFKSNITPMNEPLTELERSNELLNNYENIIDFQSRLLKYDESRIRSLNFLLSIYKMKFHLTNNEYNSLRLSL